MQRSRPSKRKAEFPTMGNDEWVLEAIKATTGALGKDENGWHGKPQRFLVNRKTYAATSSLRACRRHGGHPMAMQMLLQCCIRIAGPPMETERKPIPAQHATHSPSRPISCQRHAVWVRHQM